MGNKKQTWKGEQKKLKKCNFVVIDIETNDEDEGIEQVLKSLQDFFLFYTCYILSCWIFIMQ